jgi:hypothetical protein
MKVLKGVYYAHWLESTATAAISAVPQLTGRWGQPERTSKKQPENIVTLDWHIG